MTTTTVKKTAKKPTATKPGAHIAALENLDACESGIDWCRRFPTFAKAWAAFERPDWMLWVLGRVFYAEPWSDARKPLVRLACAVARTTLKFIPAGEGRPLKAIETAERWCDGKATQQEVIEAGEAASAYASASASAYASAYASASASTYASTYASAYASASASASASAYASASASAYAYASASASTYAFREENAALWREQCDLIREHFPKAPKLTEVR